MNNIMKSIQKFLKNKNTVTILGVIIIVAIIYFGYTTTINNQVQPIRVPVASVTIQPRTKITDEMIKYIEVPGKVVSSNVILSRDTIIQKYADYNTVIPEGSMFYNDVLTTAEEMPDSAFVDIKEEGTVPFQFAVDMKSTFGNSIFPHNQIDLYMQATDDNGQLMVGKLVENVEVLAVKDSSGNHVFENTEENRTPAYIIFAVKDELNILLLKAEFLSGVTLFPIPHGAWVGTEGKISVSSEELKNFINSRTRMLQDDIIEETEEVVDNNGQ